MNDADRKKVSVRFRAGAHDFVFSTQIRHGSGWRTITHEMSPVDVARWAATFGVYQMTRTEEGRSNDRTQPFHVTIKQGRNDRVVPIQIPEQLIIDIANAIADAADADVGHRFYHYENPSVPKPCSSCSETKAAEESARLRRRRGEVRQDVERIVVESGVHLRAPANGSMTQYEDLIIKLTDMIMERYA